MAYQQGDTPLPRQRRPQPTAQPMPQQGGPAAGGGVKARPIKPTTGGGIQSPPNPRATPVPRQSGGSGPFVDPNEVKKRVAGLPGLTPMQKQQIDAAAARGPGILSDALRGQPFEQDVKQAINAEIGAAQNALGGARPASGVPAPPASDTAIPAPAAISAPMPAPQGGNAAGGQANASSFAAPQGVPQGGITSVWNPQAREKMAAERGWGFVQQVQDAMSKATQGIPQGAGGRQQAIYQVLQQFGLTGGGQGVPQGQPPADPNKPPVANTPPINPQPPVANTPPIYVPPPQADPNQVPPAIPDIFMPEVQPPVWTPF